MIINLLHIGLIHGALTPLTTKELNTNIHIALRDCRHINYQDSLLGLT